MTRANTEQLKHTPWFAKAGAACSIVPISRFVGPNIFALKGGGYGCLFSLAGMDEESLTDLELESRVRQIEGALRGLPEGSCLYQYTRVMSGFDLPRQPQYRNTVTEVFASDRLAHLDKSAGFRRIDLHWCLTLEPGRVKPFEQKPKESAFETSRILADLEKTATLLEGHLGTSLGLEGTPQVFVNGERLPSGARPIEELWPAIDRALKAQGIQSPPATASVSSTEAQPSH